MVCSLDPAHEHMILQQDNSGVNRIVHTAGRMNGNAPPIRWCCQNIPGPEKGVSCLEVPGAKPAR